jgi:hypothetical protein
MASPSVRKHLISSSPDLGVGGERYSSSQRPWKARYCISGFLLPINRLAYPSCTSEKVCRFGAGANTILLGLGQLFHPRGDLSYNWPFRTSERLIHTRRNIRSFVALYSRTFFSCRDLNNVHLSSRPRAIVRSLLMSLISLS